MDFEVDGFAKLLQMMNRFGVLVAVSIVAYAIRELTIRSWTSLILPTNCSENGEDTEKNVKRSTTKNFRGLDEEEEIANSMNDASSQVNGRISDLEGGDDSSAELRELVRGESKNRPLDGDKKEEDKVPEIQVGNNEIEMERLLKLVMELEKKKVKLEGELLLMCNAISDVTELRRQLEAKNDDISMLNMTISNLQAERKKLEEEIRKGELMKKELEEARGKIKELQRQIHLDANKTKEHLLLIKQQVSSLQAKEEEAVKKEAQLYKKLKAVKDFEVELGELKRKNRELRHEKQELTSILDVLKDRIRTLTNMTKSEIITKEREEAQKLRSENEQLIKQIEGLQMNRFSEVEELVYLRWINACLRYELRDETSAGESARYLNKSLSPKSKEKAKQLMLEYAGLEFGQAEKDHETNFSHPFSSGIEDFDNTSIDSSRSRASSFSEKPNSNLSLKKFSRNKGGSSAVSSSRVTSSSHRWKDPLETVMALRDAETLTLSEVRLQVSSRNSVNSVATSFQLMSKSVEEISLKQKYSAQMKMNKTSCDPDSKNMISNPTSCGDEVHREPELVRFDQQMMKHEVKADMETLGDLVMPLAMEVREASFSNMEDVVSFVIWLDEKLSSLDDEMEILEHFDWPEGKTDALRKAAFGYKKLMKLREEVSSFVDSPKLTCEVALNKMHSLLDKVEQSVYAVLRTRDMAISQYEELGIPIDWLLDSGVVGKMKVSCVELARKYMKRIVNEHNALSGPQEEPNREFLLLQGVRFASRVHKFAGGFDSESMKAFEELRSRIHTEAGEIK